VTQVCPTATGGGISYMLYDCSRGASIIARPLDVCFGKGLSVGQP
jgi:hypothetical protein